MSVITDGMDFSKSNIPHFKVKLEVNLSQHQLSRYLRKAEGQKVIGSHQKCNTLDHGKGGGPSEDSFNTLNF